MIRKEFLAAAAGVAAAVTGAGTAVAANPFPTAFATPQPGSRPLPAWRRGQRGSDQNLRFEIRRLERLIDMLQRDQHDYCGHREQAIDLLSRAREQLYAGLQCDQNGGH